MTAREFSDYNRLIHRFVYDTIKANPWVEREDLVNQSWVILLRARKQWKKGAGMKFTTFFFQKLEWCRCDLIRRRVRECRAMEKYEWPLGLPDDGVEVEQAARRLAQQVGSALNRDERRVLNLMLFPSVRFRRFLAGEGDRGGRSPSPAMQTHYARFLGMHARTTSRACTKISMLLKESVHGQEIG